MRVLIVDDEPLARTALASLVSQRPDVDTFEVAEDAQQALRSFAARPFDVVLLDIQMPGMSGLQLVERLSKQSELMPAIVFVTAFQEHAVEAFEKKAVDYVLKPLVPERVHAALDVAARRSAQERASRLMGMLGYLKSLPERSTRLAVKDRGRIVFIDAREVIAAEAHGNYVLLQQKHGSHLLRETISRVAEQLKPHGFVRVHRSVLVNADFVEAIQVGPGGEHCLRMKTGKEYQVSRTYKDNLKGLAQFWMGTDEPD
jgi:two-component system LytT family response regulator